MKSYAEREIFPKEAMEKYHQARELVEWIPATDVRCHELCRIVKQVVDGLDLFDGHYAAVEHSWLMTHDKYVLDPYFCGAVPQVQLIDPTVPGVQVQYRVGRLRTDINLDLVDHWVREYEGRKRV